MSALTDLAAKCEDATPGDEPEMLVDAYEAILACGLTVPPKEAFHTAIEAKAYESAAWWLAPKHWLRQLSAVSSVAGTATLLSMERADVARVRIEAATPSLALCGALLIAWELESEQMAALAGDPA